MHACLRTQARPIPPPHTHTIQPHPRCCSYCGPHGGTCIRPRGPDDEVLSPPAAGGASASTPCMFLNAFMDKSFDYGVLVRGNVGLGSLVVNMTYVNEGGEGGHPGRRMDGWMDG